VQAFVHRPPPFGGAFGRYLKYALPVAAVALWCGLVAGSAGAAVLCTTNANCTTSHNGAGGQMYDNGDNIVANGPGLQVTTSAGDETCNKAELAFKLTGTGGLGVVVPGETTIKLEECTFLSKGGVKFNCTSVHAGGFSTSVSLAMAPDGSLTVSKMFLPFFCVGGGLVCTLGGNSLKFSVTGANAAVIGATKLPLERKEGGAVCPESAELDASFKTTTPVYVQSG